MSIIVSEGGTFEAQYVSGLSGQVGTVAVRIDDNQGATVFGPTVVGIIELGVTGIYSRTMTAPGTAGTQWSVIWSLDGTFSEDTSSSEDLFVVSGDSISPIPPLVPIDTDGVGVGPCRAWTTVEDVAACCGEESDTAPLEQPVIAATQVLYELSGRRYSGSCERRVRPCTGSCFGPWTRWTGRAWSPFDFGVYGLWPFPNRDCGCTALDRVPLAGHAREILEVTIDGDIVDNATYRLDEHRWLTRVPDPADEDTVLRWPSCQDLTLPETSLGTFSILYTYGVDPPVAGQLAAAELACAIHRTCAGGGSADGCALPSGVTKVVRQGITIELTALAAWGLRDGVWKTGLPLVDMFLNTYNPRGRRRRATVWSPDTKRFPRPVGGSGS